MKTPSKVDFQFERYQRKLNVIYDCILKSILVSSDSFCLIKSHIWNYHVKCIQMNYSDLYSWDGTNNMITRWNLVCSISLAGWNNVAFTLYHICTIPLKLYLYTTNPDQAIIIQSLKSIINLYLLNWKPCMFFFDSMWHSTTP